MNGLDVFPSLSPQTQTIAAQTATSQPCLHDQLMEMVLRGDPIPALTLDQQIEVLNEMAKRQTLESEAQKLNLNASRSVQVMASTSASSSQPRLELQDIPKLDTSHLPKPLFTGSKTGVAQCDRLQHLSAEQRKLYRIDDIQQVLKNKTAPKEQKKDTTGPKWFDMPRTVLTPEFKRELQLINMRDVLDPKQQYKKGAKVGVPKYSQIGTIIEGPTDYFGGRLTKKETKQSMISSALMAEKESGKIKRKYEEIQTTKRSGKKGYYKDLQAGRTSKFKRR